MRLKVEAMCRLGPAPDVEERPDGYRPTILLVSFLTCFALPASTGAGQTAGAMTGAINGTVTDSTSAVLRGVTIVISGAALMGTRTTVAKGDGLYRFPALAPGEYTLVFMLDGFKVVRREGIHVGLGFTATVDVELPIATLQENVIVERNSPVIDKQSTAIGATFDALNSQTCRVPEACGPFRPRRPPCTWRASISVPAPRGLEAQSAHTEPRVSIGRWSRASA